MRKYIITATIIYQQQEQQNAFIPNSWVGISELCRHNYISNTNYANVVKYMLALHIF